jgi:hypothetical protein
MHTTSPLRTRRLGAAAVTVAASGAIAAGLLGMGGTAQASTIARHVPDGYVVVDSCTGLAGQVTYSPGLRIKVLRSVKTAVMTGTTSGCSDIFIGAINGTGTFTAVMSGKASVDAENFSGTFTINWPAGSGFNPSTGTLTVTDSSGQETISGSVTGGFDTGTALYAQYAITGKKGAGTKTHPVTSQTYTNTMSLRLSRNEG